MRHRQVVERAVPEEEGYLFIIVGKVGRGEDHLLPPFWVDIKAYITTSSSSDPIWSNWDGHGTIHITCSISCCGATCLVLGELRWRFSIPPGIDSGLRIWQLRLTQLQLEPDPWPGNSICRGVARKKNHMYISKKVVTYTVYTYSHTLILSALVTYFCSHFTHIPVLATCRNATFPGPLTPWLQITRCRPFIYCLVF